MKKTTKKIALFGMLSAVALVLSLLESMIPVAGFMPPGAKAGFSNIATMFAVTSLGFPAAMAITLIKALFAGITRGMTAMLMSFSGGVLSTLAMYFLFKHTKKLGYMMIGVISAICHNAGQLFAAFILVGNKAVLGYAPVLLLSAVITGAVTGSILKAVIPQLTKTVKYMKKNENKGGR